MMVRVFVNHVDSFTGKALSKVLNGAVVGSTMEEHDVQEGTGEAVGGDIHYQVVGTLSDPQIEKPIWVHEVVPVSTQEDLLHTLLNCDVVVYDIMTDSPSQLEEVTWAVQAIHDQMSVFMSQKVFVCVSTVLTWDKSKPLDPEVPDVPFTEEDYRRRRPHGNFKDHIAVEKLVIKLGKTDKSKLTSYVVAAGLTYGEGESVFHLLFKSAWHGDLPYLPIFGNGANLLPTIHVIDLGSVVLNVIDSKPKTRYILAVDDSRHTLAELVKAISINLGTGKTSQVAKEEALLNSEITQLEFDQFGANLNMEATLAKEAMKIEWKSETGLVENILSVIKEYKETRELLPIRACILGPPAVGKSLLISQLSKFYKLHHIKVDEVIREAVEEQERLAARAEELSDNEDSENDNKAEEAQQLLDILTEDREANNGRYSEQYILDFYKRKLTSMPCQNHGFILDGFPKTYDQAKQLFAPKDTDDDDYDTEDDKDEVPQYNKLTMPEVVLCLEASDEFLKQRVMNLPQSVVEGTHNTEEGLLKRLHQYREQNEEDNTVLNYFDELEIHPEHIGVETDPTGSVTIDRMKKIIGEPRNYGPTLEERVKAKRKLEEELAEHNIREKKERERLEAEEKALRKEREAEWATQLALVQKEEQEMLETQSIPLRNYLMQHVMPTLTEGLIEVCKVKPDDAVDYLAEYLFKNNPQID